MPKDTLKKEFLDVISDLGLDENCFRIHDFRVRRLHEKRQEILEELVRIRRFFHPDLVLIPSLNDYHQDHIVVSNEAVRAFKTTASIIGYELPWNHITFDTNLFIKLEKKHIEKKFEMLQNYNSQIEKGRNYFSKEYIFGLSKVRGIQCNAEYAESFEVIRWMI